MHTLDTRVYEKMSPFEIKDELIRLALAGGGAVRLREIGEDPLQRRNIGQARIGQRKLAR